ncbi:TetR/AcrR family transcriptional regulator [Prauserella aidingensis]|uniref:TetR/AcrR family transcriptional regulator n=1 Tax=Prauserella aidingensis TaxID=387890 RepID=UPI0020A3C169|nr:TetR/AcrR family transcriptional regulator [Prauserella aidingensis]
MSRRTSPSPPAADASGRPLRADAERNRQRIITAAQEVFAQRGIEVTLDDIAHHAGVGVGTIYRRFANREELVEAIFDKEIQRVIELAEEALTREDPWDGLVHFFTAAGQDFAEDRGLREVLLVGSHGKDRVAAARDRLTPAINAVLERAQRHGSLRDDIEVTDFPLIQIMLGAATQRTKAVSQDMWQRYLTLILDALRTSRERPTALPQPALSQEEFDRAAP